MLQIQEPSATAPTRPSSGTCEQRRRCSSLTVSEYELLYSLQRETNDEDDDTKALREEEEAINNNKDSYQQNVSEDRANATRRLRASLKTVTLQTHERLFLEELVEVADSEYIIQAATILEQDAIYRSSSQSSSGGRGEGQEVQLNEQAFEKRIGQGTSVSGKICQHHKHQSCGSHDGGPFRRELWTEYKSQTTLTHEIDPQEEQQSEDMAHKKEEKVSPILEFFKGMLKDLNTPKNKLDDHDEATTMESESSSSPEIITHHILGTHVDDESAGPHAMTPPLMDALRPHLPLAVQQDNFWLKYSMRRDGALLHTLMQSVRGSARTLLVVETLDGEVLGCFTSSLWRASGEFYGSGQAFVWKMRSRRHGSAPAVECGKSNSSLAEEIAREQDIQVFPWTGANNNVQLVRTTSTDPAHHVLAVGGGPADDDLFRNRPKSVMDAAGFALALNRDLSKGTSAGTVTFGNASSLASNDVFDVANVEVWTLSPVDTLEQAIKLELGRQFVFHHGRFT